VKELPLAPCCQTMGYRVVKRAIDIVCSASALVLLSPLLCLIAVLVKRSSPGPCFYRWEVIGRRGRRFSGFKFRSMVVEADALKKELWRHNERRGPTFKMKDDPRVTRVGGVLRKFSLDELPQLWSVLKGDMSIVGPRPVAPSEWVQFTDWQRRKLTVTPGMICLGHVRGRPKEFAEWIHLDLEYIDTWSLWRDVRLVLLSPWSMASGRNY
jgi:lipopolysaccharide/colanic/teichoic acid biosynthesis glycosyltransferase